MCFLTPSWLQIRLRAAPRGASGEGVQLGKLRCALFLGTRRGFLQRLGVCGSWDREAWLGVTRGQCRLLCSASGIQPPLPTLSSELTPRAQPVKNSSAMQETQEPGRPPSRRRTWQPTPVFLPEKSQRQEPGRLQSPGSQSRTRLKQLSTRAHVPLLPSLSRYRFSERQETAGVTGEGGSLDRSLAELGGMPLREGDHSGCLWVK